MIQPRGMAEDGLLMTRESANSNERDRVAALRPGAIRTKNEHEHDYHTNTKTKNENEHDTKTNDNEADGNFATAVGVTAARAVVSTAGDGP